MSIANVSATVSPSRPSLRRIKANQQNAEKSTGPKTVEGKARSRTNAVKHGLCSAIDEPLGLDADEQSRFAERLETWRPSYAGALENGDPERELLFRHLVLQASRIEAAQRREGEIIDKIRQRARTTWEEDRSLLAETIGSTLKRNPGLGVARLRTFLQGAEWLIDRLVALKDVIGHLKATGNPDAIDHTPSKIEISEAQTSDLLDLLGVAYPSRIENQRLDRDVAIRRIDERLETLDSDQLEALEGLDYVDRRRAEKGHLAEIPKEERLNRRYEDHALREFFNTRDELQSFMNEPKTPIVQDIISNATTPQPKPITSPPPQPSAPVTAAPPTKPTAAPSGKSSPTTTSAKAFDSIAISAAPSSSTIQDDPNDTPRIRELKRGIAAKMEEALGSMSINRTVASSGLSLSKIVRNEPNGTLGKMCRS